MVLFAIIMVIVGNIWDFLKETVEHWMLLGAILRPNGGHLAAKYVVGKLAKSEMMEKYFKKTLRNEQRFV